VYFGVGSYGNDKSRAGLCYRLKTSSIEKDLIIQVINNGEDVPDNHVDLLLSGGGFGLFNSCNEEGTPLPLFDGKRSQWGNLYGGIQEAKDCWHLPAQPICANSSTMPIDDLRKMCQWSFDKNFRVANNPKITKVCNVACPEELYTLTGLHRSDEATTSFTCHHLEGSSVLTNSAINNENQSLNNYGGELTRMMDCAKPAYAWYWNIKYPTDPNFNVVVTCRRDGYTRMDSLKKS
jgi:hypothetical protein